MAYSYKKSHRYGNACSPDSSSNYTPNCQSINIPETIETNDTPKERSPTPPTIPSLSYASQTSTPASMTYEQHRTSPFSYMLSSANNVISHVPSSTYSPPLSNGHYERISNHSLSPSGSLLSLQGELGVDTNEQLKNGVEFKFYAKYHSVVHCAHSIQVNF